MKFSRSRINDNVPGNMPKADSNNAGSIRFAEARMSDRTAPIIPSTDYEKVKKNSEDIMKMQDQLRQITASIQNLVNGFEGMSVSFKTNTLEALISTFVDLSATNIDTETLNSKMFEYCAEGNEVNAVIIEAGTVVYAKTEDSHIAVLWISDDYFLCISDSNDWIIDKNGNLARNDGQNFQLFYTGTGAGGTTKIDRFYQIPMGTTVYGHLNCVDATSEVVTDRLTVDVADINTLSVGGSETVDGDLTVNGNIFQNGSAYETHAEKIYTKKDTIITRDGAVSGLADGKLTGIKAHLYDGTNDGILGFDNKGIARVGDAGEEQAIATRSEEGDWNNGDLAKWDSENKKFIPLANTFVAQSAIDSINEKIPETASAENKLADSNSVKAISDVIPEWATSENKLVDNSGLNDALTEKEDIYKYHTYKTAICTNSNTSVGTYTVVDMSELDNEWDSYDHLVLINFTQYKSGEHIVGFYSDIMGSSTAATTTSANEIKSWGTENSRHDAISEWIPCHRYIYEHITVATNQAFFGVLAWKRIPKTSE